MRTIVNNDVVTQHFMDTMREIEAWDAKHGDGFVKIHAYALCKIARTVIFLTNELRDRAQQ